MGQDRGGLIVAQLPGEWGHARTGRLKVSCNTTRAVLVILDANPVATEPGDLDFASKPPFLCERERGSTASSRSRFLALRLMWRRWAGAE